jgi:hypothetical protein
MTVATFRDTLRRVSPPWLQHELAGKVQYALGVHVDALGDALVLAVKQRFPGYAGMQSLPNVGRERRISRGRNEADAAYAARLRRWLTDHRRRGGPYALLAQLHAHFAAAPFSIELRYRSGRRYRMDVAGAIVRDEAPWSPDARPEQWARWWLFYTLPTAAPDHGAWNDAARKWGDASSVWDFEITPTEVTDYRLVPREWNAAHCTGSVVLSYADAETWNADGPWDATGKWNTATTITIPIE